MARFRKHVDKRSGVHGGAAAWLGQYLGCDDEAWSGALKPGVSTLGSGMRCTSRRPRWRRIPQPPKCLRGSRGQWPVGDGRVVLWWWSVVILGFILDSRSTTPGPRTLHSGKLEHSKKASLPLSAMCRFPSISTLYDQWALRTRQRCPFTTPVVCHLLPATFPTRYIGISTYCVHSHRASRSAWTSHCPFPPDHCCSALPFPQLGFHRARII